MRVRKGTESVKSPMLTKRSGGSNWEGVYFGQLSYTWVSVTHRMIPLLLQQFAIVIFQVDSDSPDMQHCDGLVLTVSACCLNFLTRAGSGE